MIVDFVKDGYVDGVRQLLNSICSNSDTKAYIKTKHDIFINTIMKNFRPKADYYTMEDLISLDTCLFDLYQQARP